MAKDSVLYRNLATGPAKQTHSAASILHRSQGGACPVGLFVSGWVGLTTGAVLVASHDCHRCLKALPLVSCVLQAIPLTFSLASNFLDPGPFLATTHILVLPRTLGKAGNKQSRVVFPQTRPVMHININLLRFIVGEMPQLPQRTDMEATF